MLYTKLYESEYARAYVTKLGVYYYGAYFRSFDIKYSARILLQIYTKLFIA
jgi:hypothetical protein